MTNDPADDYTLPHSLDAERSVLGAVLLHDDAFPRLAATLTADDFFRVANRTIFEGMVSLNARGTPIEFVLLKDELARHGLLDEAGGPAYLASLVDGVPRSANVEHYAAVVKEKARLRGLIRATHQAMTTAYESEESAATIADRAMNDMLAFVDTPQATVTSVGQAVTDYVQTLDETTVGGNVMTTGFIDLDAQLGGGLRPSDLVVLAGRPSAGKSSLGLAFALGVALAGHPSAFFSLEMRSSALALRMLSWTTRIDRHRIAERYLNDDDYGRIAQAVGTLGDVPLQLQDTAATLTEVSAWCQRLRAEHGLKCAVVDYLQLLAPERSDKSREREVAMVTRGLKRIARTQQLAVVAISALNRSPEGRKDNRPRLSDLRESGAIEYDADVALLLFRQEQYEPSEDVHGIAEVIVAKNRDGPTGTVRLVFIDQLGAKFENMAQGA